ncbi:DUF6708 domain-containing protein [Yersinia massiliensis]|uniref:DUF6708 domain-containing protein n=1 Tax=Yersinia massiliensis TaxID=419257 RepID=UPI0028D6328D|nr:DUF6708 domain-containing protein [Yersinia massiliensis]
MSDPKYNRLPHAGDFEIESGTEAFYLAPKPLPTGMAAFSGQRMHREFNDVFLDFAHSVSGLEFAVRASVGSHAFLMIFFFMVSGIAAWGRRHKEDFFEGWWVFFTTWPIWGVIGCFVLISFCFLYKSIHQITSVPPVRFNRQRREVAYVRQKGDPPLIVPWEEVIACVTAGTTVNPYAVMHSYSLMIGLRDSISGEVVWLTLNVGHLSLAVSEWEALRVYMEEGPLALPEPLLVDEEFQEGTVAYFHMCRGVYREMHSWPVYAFGFLTIQFCSGWTLPCRFSEWIYTRPKAAFPDSIREWSKPLPAEQHAKPSAELVQQSAELRQAMSKGQSLFGYYKVKFSEPEAPLANEKIH